MVSVAAKPKMAGRSMEPPWLAASGTFCCVVPGDMVCATACWALSRKHAPLRGVPRSHHVILNTAVSNVSHSMAHLSVLSYFYFSFLRFFFFSSFFRMVI